jgi:hypothetical protein
MPVDRGETAGRDRSQQEISDVRAAPHRYDLRRLLHADSQEDNAARPQPRAAAGTEQPHRATIKKEFAQQRRRVC